MNFRITLLLFVLSFTLRIWLLGSVPASLNWDEVSLGYNAYSILLTGRDEYAKLLPLSLRSFNDYKPPLYAYITIPFIALFGLNEQSVRLPSVVLGSLSVVIFYYLLLNITNNSKLKLITHKNQGENARILGAIGAFLLATSPWHIQFSRMAFESNIALFFILCGSLALFKGFNKSVYWIIASVCFSLSLYAYHSARIFVPILLVSTFFIFWHQIVPKLRSVLVPIIIFVLILMPLIYSFSDNGVLSRLSGTSSLSDQTGLLARSVSRYNQDKSNNNILGIIANNRRMVWVKTVISGYLSHYSLKWLFITGDGNPRHHAPDTGLLFMWQLPLLLIGIYISFLKRTREIIWFAGWFMLSAVPAAPTTEVPHAVRTLIMLPPVLYFISIGCVYVYEKLRYYSSVIKYSLYTIFIGVISFSMIHYLIMYFTYLNIEYSDRWQYGRKEVINYIKNIEDKYEKIVVSTRLEQPHMFFLFYLPYDPKTYIRNGGTYTEKIGEIEQAFGKYEFRKIDWHNEVHNGKILYVGLADEMPEQNIYSSTYLNGSPSVRVSE